MEMGTNEGRCTAVCWIAGAVVAVVSYVLMRPDIWILVAVIFALVLGVVAAVLMLRNFCLSDEASVDAADRSLDAVPAPVAAPAPGGQGQAAQTAAPAGRVLVPEDDATAEWDEASEGKSTAATSAVAYLHEDDGEAEPEGDAFGDGDEAEPVAEAAAQEQPQDAGAPAALSAPRGGQADDLKRIKGVGPKLEETLNGLGIYHFDQIAGWSAADVAWMDDNLKGFRGRVSRDDWVAQATLLAEGGETEFSKRVDKGDVY